MNLTCFPFLQHVPLITQTLTPMRPKPILTIPLTSTKIPPQTLILKQQPGNAYPEKNLPKTHPKISLLQKNATPLLNVIKLKVPQNVDWHLKMFLKFMFYWRRLSNSPANSHKSSILELSWAWEPTYSSGAR